MIYNRAKYSLLEKKANPSLKGKCALMKHIWMLSRNEDHVSSASGALIHRDPEGDAVPLSRIFPKGKKLTCANKYPPSTLKVTECSLRSSRNTIFTQGREYTGGSPLLNTVREAFSQEGRDAESIAGRRGCPEPAGHTQRLTARGVTPARPRRGSSAPRAAPPGMPSPATAAQPRLGWDTGNGAPLT